MKFNFPFLRPSGKQYEISYSEARNLPVPTSMQHARHTVKEGETLASIAEQYNLTPVQLSEFLYSEQGNDVVGEGQEIEIPTLLEERD